MWQTIKPVCFSFTSVAIVVYPLTLRFFSRFFFSACCPLSLLLRNHRKVVICHFLFHLYPFLIIGLRSHQEGKPAAHKSVTAKKHPPPNLTLYFIDTLFNTQKTHTTTFSTHKHQHPFPPTLLTHLVPFFLVQRPSLKAVSVFVALT